MREFFRRLLVIVVAGPWVLLMGPIWFLVTAPMGTLMVLMERNNPDWIWKYVWATATAPFYGFYCLLTGHQTPKEEFWR